MTCRLSEETSPTDPRTLQTLLSPLLRRVSSPACLTPVARVRSGLEMKCLVCASEWRRLPGQSAPPQSPSFSSFSSFPLMFFVLCPLTLPLGSISSSNAALDSSSPPEES